MLDFQLVCVKSEVILAEVSQHETLIKVYSVNNDNGGAKSQIFFFSFPLHHTINWLDAQCASC